MLTSKQQEQKSKQRKIRNSEYYDMISTFDGLYADSKKDKIFNHLMEIIESEEILDSAKALVAEQLGDDREIRDAYFDNTEEGAPHNSVDVTLVMEDGHIYMLTFYKDGTLRSLLYLE